jgi:cation transport regulator
MGDVTGTSHAAAFSWQSTACRRSAMPYQTNEDLPSSITRHLPQHAQVIDRAAFNHAFVAHAGDTRQEEASHRIAWAAVRRFNVKIGDSWVAQE